MPTGRRLGNNSISMVYLLCQQTQPYPSLCQISFFPEVKHWQMWKGYCQLDKTKWKILCGPITFLNNLSFTQLHLCFPQAGISNIPRALQRLCLDYAFFLSLAVPHTVTEAKESDENPFLVSASSLDEGLLCITVNFSVQAVEVNCSTHN